MKTMYESLPQSTQRKLKEVKLLAFDFDGVWTDNTVTQDQNGVEAVTRSKADSMGIDLLRDASLYDKDNYEQPSKPIDIIILSRETNEVVASVGRKIKVKVKGGLYTKRETLQAEAKARELDMQHVMFMGNDLNDLVCMKAAGLSIAPNDAHPVVKQQADYVTQAKGGRGAVREVFELVLTAHDKHPHPY